MLCCLPCNSRAAGCCDVTGGSIGRKEGGERKTVFIVPLVGAFKSNRSSSSLPGLRREVINLSQVLHRRAFEGVRQLDPHSKLLLKCCEDNHVYKKKKFLHIFETVQILNVRLVRVKKYNEYNNLTQFVTDKLTFCGLRTLMTCVTVPWLSAGTTLLLGERSCSWNVWQTDSGHHVIWTFQGDLRNRVITAV